MRDTPLERTLPRMPDRSGFIYLLVPPHLEAATLSPLREHFAEDPLVEVIVERRTSLMRPGIDNRILRDVDDLSRAERRAPTIPRGMPPLPPHLAAYAPELQIRHRLPAVRSGLVDLTVEQVVERARSADPDAHTELIWRSSERVHQRMRLHVTDEPRLDGAVKGAFGHVFDSLDEFDPESSSYHSWLDRKVDEHAKQLPDE